LRWTGHVERMGNMSHAYSILVGRPRHRWEDIRMELLGSRVGRCGLDASGLGQWPVADSREHGIKPSGSIKDGEFLDYWNNY